MKKKKKKPNKDDPYSMAQTKMNKSIQGNKFEHHNKSSLFLCDLPCLQLSALCFSGSK